MCQIFLKESSGENKVVPKHVLKETRECTSSPPLAIIYYLEYELGIALGYYHSKYYVTSCNIDRLTVISVFAQLDQLLQHKQPKITF